MDVPHFTWSSLVTAVLDSPTFLLPLRLGRYLLGQFGYAVRFHGQDEETQMQYGARNDIVGEVVELKSGDMMAQAKVKINGEFNLSSVMTTDSLAALGIEEGDKVRVLVKAVNVLLVKDS